MTHSDINSRLSRFHEIRKSVEDLEEKGAFEDVSGAIPAYLAGAQPVGLDDNKMVVYPESYDPRNGPALLPLLPGERAKFGLREVNEREVVEIERLYSARDHNERGSPGRYTRDDEFVSYSHIRGRFGASIESTGYRGHEEGPCEVILPRVLVVGNDKKTKGDDLGRNIAHEADHWDFYLNEAKEVQSDPDRRYTLDELRAIAEKRGYATSRKINKNLATSAVHTGLDQLAQAIENKKPDSYRSAMKLFADHCKANGLRRKLPMDIGVFAMSTAFGVEGVLLTSKEHKALKRLKVV